MPGGGMRCGGRGRRAMDVRFRCDPALAEALPRPRLARQALPEWLQAMPMTAQSDMHDGPVRTVKQCPPFVDAMRAGFVMPLPCDVHYADGVFTWDWRLPQPATPGHPQAPVSFHAAAQVQGGPFGVGNLIKFIGFWTIELPPGWSLLATHPVNRDDLPFRTLTGLVDSDRFHQVGLLFPARWLDPGVACSLPAGTPVAQCIPVRREALELQFSTFGAEEVAAFTRVGDAVLATPGVYRDQYRDRAR
jgi:hypothetical protein